MTSFAAAADPLGIAEIEAALMLASL